MPKELSSNEKCATFRLHDVIGTLPPDPESAARHRADILVKSDTLRVVLITMLDGAQIHEHSAPGPITVHAVEGAFTLTVDGDPQHLEPGSVTVVAPGIRHSVLCEKEGALLLTIAHLSRTPDAGGDA